MKSIFKKSILLMLFVSLYSCSSRPSYYKNSIKNDNYVYHLKKNYDQKDGKIKKAPNLENFEKVLESNKSIYFDFDSYLISSKSKDIIENHANFLLKNKNQKIQIQGNTDQRGGIEYNLALGQRRAESVSKTLQLIGVNYHQIETISFGKDKPKSHGFDETDFAENRRADIEYLR